MGDSRVLFDSKYDEFLRVIGGHQRVNRKIGVTLVGIGVAGTIHLKNLVSNSRVNLLYIVEALKFKADIARDAFGLEGTVKFLTSIDEALKDARVEAIIVATPTKSHYEIVMKALQHLKGVFCEKPLGVTPEEVKQCYQEAKANSVPLFCGFQRRFDPSLREAFDQLRLNAVGDKVHLIKSCSRDSPMPSLTYLQSSPGLIHDSAVHDIDIVCWMLGQFPSRVFATGVANSEVFAKIPDFDTVTIQLMFPTGIVGIIDVSRYSSYGYDQRVEVFGPGGILVSENQPTTSVYGSTFPIHGQRRSPIWYNFISRYSDAYKNELDHFLDVIEGKEELIVKPEEVLNTSKICDAALLSAKSELPVDIIYDD